MSEPYSDEEFERLFADNADVVRLMATVERLHADEAKARDAYYEKDAELARCEGALEIARRSSERWYKRCRSRAERIDRFREALDRIAKGPHLDTCSASLGTYPCDCHLSVAYAALFPDSATRTNKAPVPAEVPCVHEWYHGRCVHCERPSPYGAPVRADWP